MTECAYNAVDEHGARMTCTAEATEVIGVWVKAGSMSYTFKMEFPFCEKHAYVMKEAQT